MKTLRELLDELQSSLVPTVGSTGQYNFRVDRALKNLYDYADAMDGVKQLVVENAQRRQVMFVEINSKTTIKELIAVARCSSEITAQGLSEEVAAALILLSSDSTLPQKFIKLDHGYTVKRL